MVKRSRDTCASHVLAAEDDKCCRLSPHPLRGDLAEGESGVLADDGAPRGTQPSVTAAQARWTRQHASYWMKRYKDMSNKELKELQFAILVDLQKLGTSVNVLVREALLATDKRHYAALSAILRRRHNQSIASFFRTICKAAGHELPQCHFAPHEGQNGSGNEDGAGSMTFGKFVSSLFFYYQNGSRFQENNAQREHRTIKVWQLLRGVIQDEVLNQTHENISGMEDQYLEEWCNAEKFVARNNVPGVHPFSFRHETDDYPKHAIDLYSRIIRVEEFVEGIPLLANLSEKVIWGEIHQHDNNALLVAATSSDTDRIDMSQHDDL